MDIYQFIASLVGSLAWPIVVGVLLFVLRKQLIGLAIRLKELSLPGGMKATFEKELETGRSIAEQIPPEAPPQLVPPAADEESKLLRLAHELPEGAIVLSYIDLEKALSDIASKLGMGSKFVNQRSIIEELVKRNLIKREAARLFDALRGARNSAAHGVGEEQVTSSDAIEYIRQVHLLIGLLHTAEAQL
jgi:hypothetical protein